MKFLQLFWKKLAVVLLAAVMTFSALLPAVQVEAAETAETEEADAAEVVDTVADEETATTEMTETAVAESVAAETTLEETEETATAETAGDRGLTPVSSQSQADTLVDFTFLTPATRVILDGEPLMILPDTLTAHLEYYDQDGTLFDQVIRYNSDLLIYSEWRPLGYFVGYDTSKLEPLYDATTDGWYYSIRGVRYDVPVEDVEVSSADAALIEYSDGSSFIQDEWQQGQVRLYKVKADKAELWYSRLYLNPWPEDEAYVMRGSRIGGSCVFSVQDKNDLINRCTLEDEYMYYACYYYGTENSLQVNFLPRVEECYHGEAENIFYIDIDGDYVSFYFSEDIEEEGWYRVNYSYPKEELPSYMSLQQPVNYSEIKEDIFKSDPEAYERLTYRSEPMHLPAGRNVFIGRLFDLRDTCSGQAIIEVTLEKLEEGDILTEISRVRSNDSTMSRYLHDETEEFCFYPGNDYYDDYPSLASLLGIGTEDHLIFSYVNYMLSQGKVESKPFSWGTSLGVNDFEPVSETMLKYLLSVFGEITLEVLGPDGMPMDLTSSEPLEASIYTLHIVSKCGDTIIQTLDYPIRILPRDRYEILQSDDFSLAYETDEDRQFTQSAENPDEYSLTIVSHGFGNIESHLLWRLSMPVTYQKTETQIETGIDTYGSGYISEITTVNSSASETYSVHDPLANHVYDQEKHRIYLTNPYLFDSDYLELRLYDQDSGEEVTDFSGNLDGEHYLMTVTSGKNGFQKKIRITMCHPVKVESVKLSETEIYLKKGEKFQLEYELIPANTDYPEVTWESANRDVAVVNDGLINAVANGNTTVTIYAQDGEVSASCVVHVGQKKIESVKLSETEITLRPGESLQLEYELIPKDNDYPYVWWSSKDESIAKVSDEGKVTANTLGDTTVTIHAQEGEVTASCTVHVVQYHVGSIILKDRNWEDVSEGGTAETIVGSGSSFGLIFLSDAAPGQEFWMEEEELKDYTVTITNSNQSVIQIDPSNIFAPSYHTLKQGTSVLTVTVKGDGWEKTAKFNIFVQFQDVTDKSKYYYKPVYWAAEKSITKGYNGWEFGVGWNCTREDMVTFLWRMQGKPTVNAAEKKKYHFPDVESGSYYENAVVWAAKNGITKGYSSGPHKGEFGVGLDVTREEAVTFLYRVAGKPAVSAADLKQYTFKDIKSTAYYAKPVAWAAKNNITKGYSSGAYAGKFGVGLKVKREDIVTFMYRYKVK